MMEQSSGREKGHYWAIGFAISFPICFTIGLILKNIALGTSIGLVVGFSLGLILEKSFNKNPVKLSKDEIKKRKKIAWSLIIVGIEMMLFFALTYFSKN